MILSDVINKHFASELEEGIAKASVEKKFLAVHVDSGHMSVYYEYYDTLQEIDKQKGHELVDPTRENNINLIWDLTDKCLLFYDSIGMTYSAFEQWKKT